MLVQRRESDLRIRMHAHQRDDYGTDDYTMRIVVSPDSCENFDRPRLSTRNAGRTCEPRLVVPRTADLEKWNPEGRCTLARSALLP